MRIDEVMNIFKLNKCIIGHAKVQLSIQHYNALSYNFKHYEMQIHKVWYDNVNQVLEYLTQPVLKLNPISNFLEINFHPAIFELIKESEAMMKHDLGESAATIRASEHRI